MGPITSRADCGARPQGAPGAYRQEGHPGGGLYGDPRSRALRRLPQCPFYR